MPRLSVAWVMLQRVPPDIKILTPGLRFFSKSTVRRPRSAVRIAASKPAAPAPITTTSHHAAPIAAMRELGYDLARHDSKSLREIPEGDYDAAITMGCGDACPLVQARLREDWGIPDPKALPPEEFRAMRDLIEHKVKDLLARL